jgi:uncharacterized protein
MNERMPPRPSSGPAPARAPVLYEGQKHALAQLVASMDEDTRWILLVGPEGSGKSVVLQALLGELRSTDADVVVCDGFEVVEPEELVRVLSSRLQIPPVRATFLGGGSPAAAIIASRRSRTNPLAVLVDNAHGLSARSLKVLATLVGKTTAEHGGVWVVLSGPLTLEGPALRAGAKLLYVRCSPEPMTPAEVALHVERRIRGRDENSLRIAPEAVVEIARYSGGLPGRVDALCDFIVTRPAVRLSNEVSAEVVEEAAQRLGFDPPSEPSARGRRDTSSRDRAPRGRRWRRAVGVLALLLVVIALAAVGFAYGPMLMRTTRDWVTARLFPPAPPPPPAPPEGAGRARAGRRDASPAAPSGGRAAAARPDAARRPGTEGAASVSRPERARLVPPPVTAEQVGALIVGAHTGSLEDVARLLGAGVSPDARDGSGVTALMHAAQQGHVEAARLLLDKGAHVNARDRGGITPVMLAVINEKPEALQLLLDRGGDVNARSGSGWTALTFAAWKGDPDLVRTLLKHGANRNVVDKQGWSPLDYATANLRSPATELDPSVGVPAVPQSGRHAEVIPLLQGASR